jgi:oligopeptide/dipeptide ABC transporter ATP-binding protein
MFGGRVVELSPCREFFDGPLHPYGQHLVQAMRDRGVDDGVLTALSPSAELPTKGCSYACVCTKTQPVCFDEEPRLEPAGPGKGVRCHFWR